MAGDLILADKGFLIAHILPSGVTINIPPFLEHAKCTKNEIIATKNIATCRSHVEQANARIKDFKILSCTPANLRSYADKIVQLVAALVNFQFPLIKECNEGAQFDATFVGWYSFTKLYIAFNHYILWIVASKGHSFIIIYVLCTQVLCGNALFYELNNLINDVRQFRTNDLPKLRSLNEKVLKKGKK